MKGEIRATGVTGHPGGPEVAESQRVEDISDPTAGPDPFMSTHSTGLADGHNRRPGHASIKYKPTN